MNIKWFFYLLFLIGLQSVSFSQKLITREALIKFEGETPLEKIDAVSDQAASVINTETGDIVFRVLMKSFIFPRALMQEHFNENYVESETYPNAIFQGKIIENIDFTKPGTHSLNIKGSMSLHGVEKEIEVPAQIIIEKGSVRLSSEFSVAPADFNIRIPSAVKDKIAKEMNVVVRAQYPK
jgi:polyisoprenoid-binding protein YceI